jgi:hypothetical protein
MNIATQNVWPQSSGPYCGIETDIAITNYDDQDDGLGLRFTSSSSQTSVASDNQSSSTQSIWGHQLASGNHVAGYTNISLDFGTDPRSIAYMAYAYSPGGFYYHDYIYRWQMAHSSQPSYSQQVQEATTILASQLENYHEPLSVTINGGAHSILVGGTWSTNNPQQNFPANLTGITYRDPQNNIHSMWDIGTWTNGIPGGYGLWNTYYNNYPADPEPGVGIYVPNGSYPSHWYNGFTWIARDGYTSYGPDYAYTALPGTPMFQP